MKDLVKCGCDEYPECTHVLYWHQGFKAGTAHDQANSGLLPDAKFLEPVKASVEQVRQLTLHSWPSTHSNPPDIENWRTTIACLIKNCQELENTLATHDQKVREQVLEEAAQVIDQCNRYNAIQGASRIRALAKRT